MTVGRKPNYTGRQERVDWLIDQITGGRDFNGPAQRELGLEWGITSRAVREMVYEARRAVSANVDKDTLKARVNDLVDDAAEAARQVEKPFARAMALTRTAEVAAKFHGVNEPDRVQQESVTVQVEMELRGFLELLQKRLTPDVFAQVLAVASEVRALPA